MIVSYNWLKELVDLNKIDKEQLLHDLSLYSIEIDSVNKVTTATGLVVGKVVSMVEHPDSDHLHVCMVDTGSDVRQIVCGAPNCQENKKVIVALPGAKLPGGEIKDAKVRGVESHGMLCSLQELGIEAKFVPEEFAKGIYFFDDSAKVGNDAIQELMYDDLMIELGLTPNRMDLMGMLGVARDVSAMYNTPLIPIDYQIHEDEKSNIKDYIDVQIDTKDCLMYSARIIKNVKIGPSPEFIKTRLMIAGVRPINNVVDITNYCLMLFSQPLHAFDYDKLNKKILVRNAYPQEIMKTLDGVDRELCESDIVICDTDNVTSRSIALGGVMGGMETEIEDGTTNICLEAAVFNPKNIRATSKRLNLRSESSSRYERGVDINQTTMACDYACYLMEKYAGGTVVKGRVIAGTEHVEDRVINLTVDDVKKYLGIDLNEKEIVDIFNRLGFVVENQKGSLTVYVPNRRMDIEIKADLIEEVARMNGYDKLACTLPVTRIKGGLTDSQRYRREVSDILSINGMNEVISYSLVNHTDNEQFRVLVPNEAKTIMLMHPITSDHESPRMNLINSLIGVCKYNESRQMKNSHFFEIGKVYYTLGEEYQEKFHLAGIMNGVYNTNFHNQTVEKVDYYVVKGILEAMFAQLNIQVSYEAINSELLNDDLHPTRTAAIKMGNEIVGFIGELHPRLLKNQDMDETYVFEIDLDKVLKLKKATKFNFRTISKVPPIERDLALIIDEEQRADEVLAAIYSSDKKTIVNVEIFDEYKGIGIAYGKKSIAVRITFDSENTLSEEEISGKIARILKSLEYRYHITLRK